MGLTKLTRGSGHHLIPYSLWTCKTSADVAKLFNGDDARIFNDYYDVHMNQTIDGVSHVPKYNQSVAGELADFLREKHKTLDQLTPEEAQEFLKRIKNAGGDIGKFNKGVRAEAQAALKARTRASKLRAQALGKSMKALGFVAALGLAQTAFACVDPSTCQEELEELDRKLRKFAGSKTTVDCQEAYEAFIAALKCAGADNLPFGIIGVITNEMNKNCPLLG
jgi:hypothetical protein